MVKSIYVGPQELWGIEKAGANHLIVSIDGLNESNWHELQKLGVTLSITLSVVDKNEDRCILDPEIQKRLFQNIDFALKFNPAEIWVDRFRFGGDCTGISDADTGLAHQECSHCRGKDRTEEVLNLAKEVKRRLGGRTRFGLFAVAFKTGEAPSLAETLGLDYTKLEQIVDVFSPMLYYRMIKKSVGYISEYVDWLAERTSKLILPIIQIKDMPDDLEDKMSEEDIVQAFNEAVKKPSIGVCFFWWQHALEKNKTGIISKLFHE